MQETWVQSLVQEDLLEEEMATHSSILDWRIPQTEEPGRLQSIGWQRIEHGWVHMCMCARVHTHTHTHTHTCSWRLALPTWAHYFKIALIFAMGFPDGSAGKETACNAGDPLKKEMATHSSILAWEIPRTEGLAGYSPWGHKRVGHNLATKQQQIPLMRKF